MVGHADVPGDALGGVIGGQSNREVIDRGRRYRGTGEHGFAQRDSARLSRRLAL